MESSEMYVHSISEAGRVLPSASRWNSMEIDFGKVPESSSLLDSALPRFSKSYDFALAIPNKDRLRRFVYVATAAVLAATLLSIFLRRGHHGPGHYSSSLPLALSKALLFFDSQKSGALPENYNVGFRADSGTHDGDYGVTHADLVGGFYDSGNNIKFSFTTAYAVTLLSWTVVEYHPKYEAMSELDHVRDIIKWGTDYLLKLFVPYTHPNSTSPGTLYSQVGSTLIRANQQQTDLTCWQRPEDMAYPRPVSFCQPPAAADLAGEIVAAQSAASLVFSQEGETHYSSRLVQAAETLYANANTREQGTYTAGEGCGGEARGLYNSSGYADEVAWGGTWLFLATGNSSYLRRATESFLVAVEAEDPSERGMFYWNNKIAANAVLLTRVRYLLDPGYPFDDALVSASNMTADLLCSYLYQADDTTFGRTPGGLILPAPNTTSPLHFAATAAFLSNLYSDYLTVLGVTGGSCPAAGGGSFSLAALRGFAASQVGYALGDNPMNTSYVVGFGDQYPERVHHRAASIPWDGRRRTCEEGEGWRKAKGPNPNVLVGALVAGPDEYDMFDDNRERAEYTEPTIAGNAGLAAALVALVECDLFSGDGRGGIDPYGMFKNVYV